MTTEYYTVQEGRTCDRMKHEFNLHTWCNVKTFCKDKDKFYHTLYERISARIAKQKKKEGIITVNGTMIEFKVMRERWMFMRLPVDIRKNLIERYSFSITDEARAKRKKHNCPWCGSPRAGMLSDNGYYYCNTTCEKFSKKFMGQSDLYIAKEA